MLRAASLQAGLKSKEHSGCSNVEHDHTQQQVRACALEQVMPSRGHSMSAAQASGSMAQAPGVVKGSTWRRPPMDLKEVRATDRTADSGEPRMDARPLAA